MKKMLKLFIIFTVMVITSQIVMAQPDYSQLDPKPYDPKTEPDPDMFIGHWKDSMPRHMHGSLVVRDILTKLEGDHLRPTKKVAVLVYINYISYATLEERSSTVPSTLKNEQQIFYINSGKGIIKSGKKTAELREGIGIVIPPDIEFTMTNTGAEPLTMYLLSEPIPEGFTPKKEIGVNDEYAHGSGINVHW